MSGHEASLAVLSRDGPYWQPSLWCLCSGRLGRAGASWWSAAVLLILPAALSLLYHAGRVGAGTDDIDSTITAQPRSATPTLAWGLETAP
jgi:hypothetical protein